MYKLFRLHINFTKKRKKEESRVHITSRESYKKSFEMVKNPSKIKNKTKRTEVYAKYKQQKLRLKRLAKEERLKTNEALGDKAPPKLVSTN